MIVFVEKAAEATVAVDAQMREGRGIVDRSGQRLQGSGFLDALVTSMVIVVAFVLV